MPLVGPLSTRRDQTGSQHVLHYERDFNSPWNEKHMTGTSLIAVEYDGGVVLGADCRSTTGQYIANRNADKLTPVAPSILCCRSGSSADTQAQADVVKYHLNFHRMELGDEPPVEVAAALFQDLCYNYRDSMLAGIIVGGWDKVKGGQVYAVPIGGMMVRQPVAVGGSGSTYIYGYIDAHYKPGMSKEDCLQFVTNAITLAIQRDGSSGGSVQLATISKDGIEKHRLHGNKLPKFFCG